MRINDCSDVFSEIISKVLGIGLQAHASKMDSFSIDSADYNTNLNQANKSDVTDLEEVLEILAT